MLNTIDSTAKARPSDGRHVPTQVRFQPTLFVYLGTSSGQIAYRVKKLLKRAYGNVPVLRHLWVDIDTDIDPRAQPWFTASERAELSGLNPSAVIKNIENYPSIKEWWPDMGVLKAGMLAGGGAPQQMRLVGRLALFRMFNDRTRGTALIDRLKSATEALFEIENIRATEAMSTADMKFSVEQGCRVVIVHSTGGGTGSAISFDVAYLCRGLLQGKNPTVISISILPPVIDKAIQNESPAQKDKVRANTYAWFKEDNFLSENPSWHVQYPEGAVVDVAAPPFDYRFVIDIQNQANYRLDSADDVYSMVAQSIFLDTGSSIAGAMRGFTANVTALGDVFEGLRRSFSSLAAASLIYPKERLLGYCASRMGHSLLADGLLGSHDEHLVIVDVATSISQLRLRDADLLADLLGKTSIKMDYQPAILKADSVAAAVTQIDAQETLNQVARRAEIGKLNKISQNRLQSLQTGLNREIAQLAATKGFKYAEAVIGKLLEPAPAGMIDAGVVSFDGLKNRILQLGVTDSDLQMAKKEYETARQALKKLDDGPEDVLERAINRQGWNKKFGLFKREAIAAMGKLNDITIQIAAQQYATGAYDNLASLASELNTLLSGAITAVKTTASELDDRARQLSDVAEARANTYEFMREIDADFDGYYDQHTTQIDPKAVFQGMVPTRVTDSVELLSKWSAESLETAALDHARRFFVEDLEATSLLSTLESMARKRGIEPQAFIEQQLDDLIEYCHPFWQYDKDRGLSDLEGKSILGVEDENSPLIPSTFRNGALYEVKTTGFRDRIDVVRIRHGLPAFLISGMDEYRAVYEKKRKGVDPLHVLPDMEFAPDLMPEKGQRGLDLFAIGLAFDYIVQLGSWYYVDLEREYATHHIQPGPQFRLAQGREKSAEVFSRKEEWLLQVDRAVESDVRSMGNDAAIKKLDEVIEARKVTIAHTPANDESLRKQFEKEINAFKGMQRRLGKVG